MQPIDLSIVIINWNTRQLLEDCLSSVVASLASSGLQAQVLVVDNASSDGSVELVRSVFPGVELMVNERNLGFAAANNQAFEHARGRHVLLLNSDTLVHGDVLARSVDYLDQHEDVGAFGCRVLNADGSLQPSTPVFPGLRAMGSMTLGLDRWRAPEDGERDVDVLSGCYLLIRASALRETGSLDSGFFFFGEETDWCLRLKRAGWRLVHAPVGSITHFGGGSARRLAGRRDLLLTGALVRLQRKHAGVLGAVLMWLLLLSFNVSRALGWRLRALLGGERASERARHFHEVVAGYGRVWSIAADARAGAAELDASRLGVQA